MTKEETYLEHKKSVVNSLVKNYNEKYASSKQTEIEVDKNLSNSFCTPNECNKCGFCKSRPCVFSPSDFLDIKDLRYMMSLLDTGLITVSSYGNGLKVIRTRGKANSKRVASSMGDISKEFSGNNPCLLYGSEGCMLPLEYRPSEGLIYRVQEDNVSLYFSLYDQKHYLEEYRKYQKVLHALYNLYKNQNSTIPIEEEEIKEKIKSFTRIIAGYID